MERILVIDDNSQELLAINQALSLAGNLETHGVNHGDAAFEHLTTSPRLPDLILLDVDMPEMSGLEVLAGIKLDPRWSTIPVILMTTTAGEFEEQGLNLGASDWIQKPIQAKPLVVRIHHQLRQHRQRIRSEERHKKVQESSSLALRAITHSIMANLDGIHGHWDHFRMRYGKETEICPPEMAEEMPALLHELRSDVTRILRIVEGTDLT